MAQVNVTDEELNWLVQRRAQNIVALAAEGDAGKGKLKELLASIFDLLQYIP